MMFKKKKQLEMELQRIPPHVNPKAVLEQYSTPSYIAADLLWNAYSFGDVEGLKVGDLGCGTGIFAIGALLMGASESIGVDIDTEAISIAKTQAAKMGVDNRIRFCIEDVDEFKLQVDTVFQNPPFGAQKANRREADRKFMTKAIEVAPVVYSFHLNETEEFVVNFFKNMNSVVTDTFHYSFPIPKIYDFHTKERVDVDVVVLRVERKD